MRFGVVPLLDGDSGGVYQYSLSILSALARPGTLGDDDSVVLFVHDPAAPIIGSLARPEWLIRPLSPPSLRRGLVKTLRRSSCVSRLLDKIADARPKGTTSRIPEDLDQPRFKPDLGRWFKKAGVDVMLFPVPMSISFECGLPYIFTVHDLQHRLQPHFPEVGSPDEWKAREYLFRNGVRNALVVVADSEQGRKDVLNCYGDLGIADQRVHALPFLPADYIPREIAPSFLEEVKARYHLPPRYFFYPAQFWPHKNHHRLIEALALLKSRHGIEAPLVLCGSHNNWIRQATFEQVMTLATREGVDGQVRYLGFVPDRDIPALYVASTGLLMPTFFGPTNIPILEAWSLGCPVMTSDIPGVRDQAGDAALLVDPNSVAAMAEAMLILWKDESRRTILTARGRERLSAWGPNEFAARLSSILATAKSLL